MHVHVFSLIKHISMLEEILTLKGLALVTLLCKAGTHLEIEIILMAMSMMMPMMVLLLSGSRVENHEGSY